jgi:signal transduction histidine kinase/ActR/RegA family two-component response regulator
VTALIDILRYVTTAAAFALAAVAVVHLRRGGQARRWGAAAFAALALVLLVSSMHRHGMTGWAGKALVCVLLVFPYFLLRFTASLGTVPKRFVRLATAATGAILVASLALPPLPAEGTARPGWFAVYAVVIVVFWAGLSVLTIAGLWREGSGQPTLARRRARMMSAATGGMTVLIVLAAAGFDQAAGQLTVQALLLVSLAAFGLGFAPPAFVRLAWRQPEQAQLRRATEQLMEATTVAQVTDTLLPHIARIVGGSGAALCDEHGEVLARVGSVPHVDLDTADELETVQLVRLSPPFGALVVATSALTPFFGREEVGLLRSLGAIADLSLNRCALTERDQASQIALREAMQRAERANTAKSDFLSRMSHELRTPLNVVLGFGQILEMRGALVPKDADAVAQILKAGHHLLELINEVLDLSRIESGHMTISPEPVELASLAGEALDLIAPLAQERAVQLTSELADCRCHVTADRQRLKQVLLNLLSNAVKYNRDGGDVSVSCVQGAAGRLRLRVTDTGPGIPAAMMDRLFEPFERLGAEGGRVEGTGLGLALSRQLVKLMGGEIGAESSEGEGSTFWIELAVAQPPQDDPVGTLGLTTPELDEPAANRRVLLIEDNLANLKLIEVLTSERAHIQLLPAMTGRLGLELARDHAPDLILLDQHLPDLTGTEVLHRLKANPETRTIPVVIVSADATPGQVRRMRDRGAADYLTKPLDIPRFLRVLEGVIAPEELDS